MKDTFDGFAPGKQPTFAIYTAFISDLLPLIDDLAELKVTLYFMWAIQQREGRLRYLSRQDFLKDANFMAGLAGFDFEPSATLDDALARACARGTLLVAEILLGGEPQRLYFINTEQGRAALEQVKAGGWVLSFSEQPVEIIPDRPNIYHLYEDNIGKITPMIADALKDAEREYPVSWIEEAIRIAVTRNARSWRFIQVVLDSWEKEGKKHEESERHAEPDGQRFLTGKYADLIKH